MRLPTLPTLAAGLLLSSTLCTQAQEEPNNFCVKYDKGWRFHVIDEIKLIGKLKDPPKPKYVIDRFGVVSQDIDPPVTTGGVHYKASKAGSKSHAVRYKASKADSKTPFGRGVSSQEIDPPVTTGAGGGGNETVRIDMYPGFALRYKASKPFASAVVGNPEVVDALPHTDEVLLIPKAGGGETNILLLDNNGLQVANVWITVASATARAEDGKVRIHDKLDDVTAFTNYQCSAAGCMRSSDKMEGTDRAKPPSTVISIGDYTSRSTNTNTNTNINK
jgi:hypothetical protein